MVGVLLLSMVTSVLRTPARSIARSSIAVHACAMANEPAPAIYAPFIHSALRMFDDFGIALEPYAFAEDLSERESISGTGKRRSTVRLTTQAYSAEKIRQIRLAHIEGGSSLQVLNFCIFPALEYGIPSFSADLVTLPGGHLIALDWAPNGVDCTAPADGDGGAAELSAPASRLAHAFAHHRARLPEGGEVATASTAFFSSCFLFSRLPISTDAEALREAVLPAFEDYLRSSEETRPRAAAPCKLHANLSRARLGPLRLLAPRCDARATSASRSLRGLYLIPCLAGTYLQPAAIQPK